MGDVHDTDSFAWSFGRDTYDSRETFVAAFEEYNREIMGIEGPITDFPLVPGNRLLLAFEGVAPGEEDYDECEVEIRSAKAPLMFLEFMYLANNELHPYLKDADHVFYEGLEPTDPSAEPPEYLLYQGS